MEHKRRGRRILSDSRTILPSASNCEYRRDSCLLVITSTERPRFGLLLWSDIVTNLLFAGMLLSMHEFVPTFVYVQRTPL
jgi:hypothetical protein